MLQSLNLILCMLMLASFGLGHGIIFKRGKQCGPGSPCEDGSCCSSEGKCGYPTAICKGSGKTTCISNCNATATCGIYSKGGSQKCGLNTCCSGYGSCGTTSLYCENADPIGKTVPCQKGFGSCKEVSAPSCTATSASKGRKVGYYQAGNVRDRACESITPSQIITTGLTHLVFAFASIDPVTFNITSNDASDTSIYPNFTGLKTSTLQTWIAIGGGSFSSGKTLTTWSDMCSTAANRQKFITSLISFMSTWGFQGVDLDWEFPVQAARGGRAADTANLVSLTKELRAAVGKNFGISVALPPDFYSLQSFDPKGMEPYVDFFNFMAYDLHGPWEASDLGSYIRPQTDARDVANSTTPLWFSGIDTTKINLGLADYGRGYTLSNKSCISYPFCAYKGPSRPGPCTQESGILSLREIQQLIAARSLKPVLDTSAMIKTITWDDQWMAYDDADTFAMKTAWADKRCLGGTQIWSVDFNSGAGSGDPPTSAWNTPATANSTNTTNQSAKLTKSPDATCGGTTGYSCLGSSFGNCCSSHGWCGSTTAYCSSAQKCQANFGSCSK